MALKNEIGKNFGNDTFTIRPYAGLKAEYGRFSDIKEKNGVLRLHVDGNDYYSVKPEVGVEFSYVQPVFTASRVRASLGLSYDYELGKVENIENRAKYIDTTTDWFKFKGVKEGERSNFKADLKLGLEAGNYGITVNGIAPGPTATPMMIKANISNLALERLPLGRYITTEEIANMAIVLVGDMGRSIMGDIVYMTGGAGNLTYDDVNYSF